MGRRQERPSEKAARAKGLFGACAEPARGRDAITSLLRLLIRSEAIPSDVAQSMAFEGESVSERTIREALARIEWPAPLKYPVAY